MVIFQHFWVVNAALTVALGVVTARTVAGTIERGIETPPGAPSAVTRSAPPVGAAPEPLVRSSIIVERNLFNSKSPGGVVEAPPAPGQAAGPLPPLNARLIGTVLGAAGGYAVIEDGATRRQDLYRLNETVLGDAKLVAIERDRVRLKRGGRTEVLELAFLERSATPAVALPPVAAAEPPQTTSGVARAGENRFVIDQRELNAAVENMNQLLTQARMVPFFNAGRADGFRIFAIRPNSLFEKIGLRDGDVLQRVNGSELSDPARAFELFEQLKNEKTITVDLVRNNVKQTLSYDIR
jgi:general secretion pathway protein C